MFVKKLVIYSFYLLILFSCNKQIDINAPYKDITVIYGLLDANEDTNWVRVQRGYLGKESASASFNEPDSLYYRNAKVILRSYDVNSRSLMDTTILIEDNSIMLNPGIFTTESHRVYHTTDSIYSNREYEIVVRKPEYDLVASGKTFIVEPMKLIIPNVSANNFRGRIKWSSPSRASLYQIYLSFYYTEHDTSTDQTQQKALDFYLGKKKRGFNELVIQSSVFFGLIRDRLNIDHNKFRFFNKIRITVWAADNHLETFINLNAPSIGIGQIRPVFKDIENGTGIFSSRTSVNLDDIRLIDQWFTGLQTHEILCDYQFASIRGSDTCICNNLFGSNNDLKCF